jgi:hypothetical protein
MTRVFEFAQTMGVLSLSVLSLLASVQTQSAQDKSPSAQAAEKPATPRSQAVAPTNDAVPPVARQLLEVTRKWLNGEMSTPGVSAEIREVLKSELQMGALR